MQGTHVPGPALVELAHAWQTLTEYQRALDTAATAARNAVSLEPLEQERPDAIAVEIESHTDHLTVNVALHGVRPGSLRAWATSDLLLLRGEDEAGALVERLVRLPVSIDPESTETVCDESTFVVTLDRRPATPTPLWASA
jgi:hypothetical protein